MFFLALLILVSLPYVLALDPPGARGNRNDFGGDLDHPGSKSDDYMEWKEALANQMLESGAPLDPVLLSILKPCTLDDNTLRIPQADCRPSDRDPH